jgi:hypothetical protein
MAANPSFGPPAMSHHFRLVSPPNLADELDALQDQVLAQLDLLNQRIEAVIKEFAPPTAAATSDEKIGKSSGPPNQDDKAAA